MWISKHPEHFVEDHNLIEEVMVFIDQGIAAFPNKEQELNNIRNMIDQAVQQNSTKKYHHDEGETEQQEDKDSESIIVYPEESSGIDEQDYSRYMALDILKLDSKKVAQQMTIIDFELYQRIRASELLVKAKPSSLSHLPHVIIKASFSFILGQKMETQGQRESQC